MEQSILRLTLACWAALPSGTIRAGPPPKLASDVVDKVMGTFGREIAKEGSDVVRKRLSQMGARCGADALRVFEHTGPNGLRALEAAGADAIRLAPVLARQGRDAAWLVANPGRTALVLRHGDDAAKALIRHRHVGEAMIRQWGAPAAEALAGLHPQNGRRLAMLFDAGTPLARAEARSLMKVIAEHGNLAMDFVWRHKGPLAISACVVAFVNDPAPFLAGGRDLAQVLGHTAMKPVAEVVGEASRQANWTVILLVGCAAIVVLPLLRLRRNR